MSRGKRRGSRRWWSHRHQSQHLWVYRPTLLAIQMARARRFPAREAEAIITRLVSQLEIFLLEQISLEPAPLADVGPLLRK